MSKEKTMKLYTKIPFLSLSHDKKKYRFVPQEGTLFVSADDIPEDVAAYLIATDKCFKEKEG